jgi:hypothetical protein
MKKKNKMKNRVLIILVVIALIITITLIVSIFIKPKTSVTENGEPINENFTFLIDSGDAEEIDSSDLITYQRGLLEDILNQYNKKDYTITNPLVINDPFESSPQTALIMFKTSKKEKVTITIKGKHNDDIVRTFEASKDHYIPVYGLYGGYENTVIVETESGKSNTLTIKTPYIGATGEVEVLTNTVSNSNGSFYFGTTALGTASIAYDNYGEIRWYLTYDYSKGMTMLQNGNILLSNINEGIDVNSAGGAIEVDMLGFVHHDYNLVGGYHHDAYEMENGDLVILTTDMEATTIEDEVVVIDRTSGQEKKAFKLAEIVKAIDPDLFEDTEINWGWINGVSYDKNTNELVLSLRNRNSIVSLDYDTGNIKWILGDIKYWSSAFKPYILTGVGDNFSYTLGQHSPTYDGTTLTLFNNGYDAYQEVTKACSYFKDKASYAMKYKIDETNMTAEVTYKFGGTEYFSYALSSYNKTYDGNMLFNSGWHMTEETAYDDPTCTQFSTDKYNSYIIELDDNDEQIVALKVGESKFEVVKADIYNLSLSSVNPNNTSVLSNYVFNENAVFTTTDKADDYETLTEEEALEYKTNEICPVTFELINKQFAFVGSVPTEMDFRVTLISTRGKAYRFTIKEAGTDASKLSVNLSDLPAGRYYVYVNMGDLVYDTREYIVLD